MTFNRRYSPRTHAVPFTDPGAAIGDPPFVSICINKEWVPFLTGVMEVLATPHYWNNPDIQVPQVEDLIAQLGKEDYNCCPEPYLSLNWMLEITGQSPSLHEWTWWQNLEFDFDNTHHYTVHALTLAATGMAKITARGFTVIGGDPAGGKIRWLHMEQVGGVIAPPGVFEWVDCLGVHNTEIIFGSDFTKQNFEAKEMILSYADDFILSIVLEGNYLCTVA